MCGVYGMVALGTSCLSAPDVHELMAPLLRHRGPDGNGLFRSERAIMGAQRLRIVDRRPTADQPFSDPSSRVWLICNGEIYNHEELRRRYSDYPYRSRSDVEPILPVFLEYGAKGLAQLEGMFALAIWDARTGKLILARDRAGEKPLFYSRNGDEVVFASEIQALLAHPVVSRDLDPAAVAQYLELGYVLEPHTMFKRIHKLEAGTIHRFGPGSHEIVRYWEPPRPTGAMPIAQAADRIELLLRRSVERQSQVGRPIGVFCSGGIDSSLIAAYAARAVGPPQLRLFTVGFADPSFDESRPAAALARWLGAAHTIVRADFGALRSVLDILTGAVAEPIGDPAALPTYLLARAARESVSVVLSGEGADELFGGYPTYMGHLAAPRFGALPSPVRRVLRRAVERLPSSDRKVPLEFLLKRFVAAAELEVLERHTAWFGTDLSHDGSFFRWIVPADRELSFPSTHSGLAAIMALDYRTYLRENLLTKIDRTTMLCSLEARAPYLDRELTEFALALRSEYHVHGITTKRLLKEVARRWLPRRLAHRRKRGLSVPTGRWLNEELRTDVDRLLSPARLEAAGLLPAARVGRLLSEHRSGRVSHARALWPLLVFELWRERWSGG